MIVTIGHLRMPADQLAAIQEDLNKAVGAARAQDGCISYAFAVDMEDSSIMRVSEVWRDMDAIKAHMAKPHFAELAKVLGGVDVTEQVVNLYPAETAIPFGG